MLTPLSCFYLKAQYGADWPSKAPIKLCERAFAGVATKRGEQVVVLSKVGGLGHCVIFSVDRVAQRAACCVDGASLRVAAAGLHENQQTRATAPSSAPTLTTNNNDSTTHHHRQQNPEPTPNTNTNTLPTSTPQRARRSLPPTSTPATRTSATCSC